MTYQYLGLSFPTARGAAKASVSDYLYAGGKNSDAEVAAMNASWVAAELWDLIDNGEWVIEADGYNSDLHELRELVREVIAEACDLRDADKE